MKTVLENFTIYTSPGGDSPFNDWFDGLEDWRIQDSILTRLNRLQLGNPGNHRRLSEHLFELKFYPPPAYRVYYGVLKKNRIVLLCGGTKKSQKKRHQESSTILGRIRE